MVATGAVAAVGGAFVVWPLISQMNPDASVLAMASIEVDLAPIAEGQAIILKWRGNPLIVRHRSKADIDTAKAVKPTDLLDGVARNANVKEGEAATDDNRIVDGKSQYLVMLGVCTHLGCVPKATKAILVWLHQTAQRAAGFALATVRNMIQRAACAKARHRKTCLCHLTNMFQIQKFLSANWKIRT